MFSRSPLVEDVLAAVVLEHESNQAGKQREDAENDHPRGEDEAERDERR